MDFILLKSFIDFVWNMTTIKSAEFVDVTDGEFSINYNLLWK